MTRISYIAGRYLDHAEAVTPIEDRGYQLADGVYEYCAFYNRRLLDTEAHLNRLARSLKKLRISEPMPMRALALAMQELIDRNTREDGGIYVQVTRGVARRDHPFPGDIKPVLSMSIFPPKNPKPEVMKSGVRVITHPDERWEHCDIKSISLLANVLAKQAAKEAKAYETWLLLPDGTVTEGSSSNAFIITDEGIITHPADNHILGGITRDAVLKIARENGIRVSERPFNIIEAKAAKEAFLTSTSPNVLPVVQIDDTTIGNGKPGEVTKKLLALYCTHIAAQTGKYFA